MTKKEKRMLKALYKWSRLEIDTLQVARILNVNIYNKHHPEKTLYERDIVNKCYKEFGKLNYDFSMLKKSRSTLLTTIKSSNTVKDPGLSKEEFFKLLKLWSTGKINNEELCNRLSFDDTTLRYVSKMWIVINKYYPSLKLAGRRLIDQHKSMRVKTANSSSIEIRCSNEILNSSWKKFRSAHIDRFEFFNEIELYVNGEILQNEIKYRTIRYSILKMISRQLNLPYLQVKDAFSSNAYTIRGRSPMYGKSSHEDKIYDILLTKYLKDDIIRQYSSEEYPYNCDFYIKSENLYLEYNGSQYHNRKEFNPNDPNDLSDLWRLKSKVKFYLNSKGKWKLNQYQAIIDTWTIRDVAKFKTARENNLNYVAIYSMKEFDKWWKGKQ